MFFFIKKINRNFVFDSNWGEDQKYLPTPKKCGNEL